MLSREWGDLLQGAEAADRDVARGRLEDARQKHVPQIFLGRSRRRRWQVRLHGSVIGALIRLAEGIDVHVVADR